MKEAIVKLGGYTWSIHVVPRNSEELGQGNDGRTIPNKFDILIADDLNYKITRETLIHELVHAMLDVQGRCYQKTFKLEEVCEFVGWCGTEIIEKADRIMRELQSQEEGTE